MTRFFSNPHTAARVIDGLTFVVTPDDSKLHTLNPTATCLWQLAKEGCNLEEATQKLMSLYEVDHEQAKRDVEICFEDLVHRAILLIAE